MSHPHATGDCWPSQCVVCEIEDAVAETEIEDPA